MTEASLLIQLFYEIAMSIGTTLDLESMLKTSLSTYLRKLNCSAGVVLRLESDADARQSFEPVLSIPRNALKNAACRAAIDRVQENMSEYLFRQFMESLPIVETSSPGKHFHIMRLPDFGLLVLVKSGRPFDYPILQSLKRLNAKLADSCLACLRKEKLERLNRRLVHEVSERRRAENDLKNVLEDLESMVEARTSELSLANERLRGEIAERKKTEKALSESERRYRSIFDNICDTFFAADENGVVVEITPSFKRVSGRDRREILGQPFESFFKAFPGHPPLVFELREKRALRDLEMLLEDKDGERRICAVNARIVGDHEGETAGIVGSVRDMTEQRAAEMENRRLEEKLARSQKMEALGLLAGGGRPRPEQPAVRRGQLSGPASGFHRTGQPAAKAPRSDQGLRHQGGRGRAGHAHPGATRGGAEKYCPSQRRRRKISAVARNQKPHGTTSRCPCRARSASRPFICPGGRIPPGKDGHEPGGQRRGGRGAKCIGFHEKSPFGSRPGRLRAGPQGRLHDPGSPRRRGRHFPRGFWRASSNPSIRKR